MEPTQSFTTQFLDSLSVNLDDYKQRYKHPFNKILVDESNITKIQNLFLTPEHRDTLIQRLEHWHIEALSSWGNVIKGNAWNALLCHNNHALFEKAFSANKLKFCEELVFIARRIESYDLQAYFLKKDEYQILRNFLQSGQHHVATEFINKSPLETVNEIVDCFKKHNIIAALSSEKKEALIRSLPSSDSQQALLQDSSLYQGKESLDFLKKMLPLMTDQTFSQIITADDFALFKQAAHNNKDLDLAIKLFHRAYKVDQKKALALLEGEGAFLLTSLLPMPLTKKSKQTINDLIALAPQTRGIIMRYLEDKWVTMNEDSLNSLYTLLNEEEKKLLLTKNNYEILQRCFVVTSPQNQKLSPLSGHFGQLFFYDLSETAKQQAIEQYSEQLFDMAFRTKNTEFICDLLERAKGTPQQNILSNRLITKAIEYIELVPDPNPTFLSFLSESSALKEYLSSRETVLSEKFHTSIAKFLQNNTNASIEKTDEPIEKTALKIFNSLNEKAQLDFCCAGNGAIMSYFFKAINRPLAQSVFNLAEKNLSLEELKEFLIKTNSFEKACESSDQSIVDNITNLILKAGGGTFLKNLSTSHDYQSFASCINKQHFRVAKLLLANYSEEELHNALSARNFQILNEADIITINWLCENISPERHHELLFAPNNYSVFRNALSFNNYDVLEALFSHVTSNDFRMMEGVNLFTNNAQNTRLLFDFLKNQTIKNTSWSMRNFRNILSVPSIQNALLDEPILMQQLMNTARRFNNEEAIRFLMTIHGIAAIIDQPLARQNINLRAVALDEESSTRELTECERACLSGAAAHYAKELAKGSDNIIVELKKDIKRHYEKAPATFATGDGRIIELPFEWKDFQSLMNSFSEETREKALKAYYAHPIHTAARYFMDPNPWMAVKAAFVNRNDYREGTSNFKSYQDLIALCYTAAKDTQIPGTDGYTVDTRVTFFFESLGLINRAHNWDQRRLNPLTGQMESYDDLEADNPSCHPGTRGRLAISVQGHPLMKTLNSTIINAEIDSFVRQHFIELFSNSNIDNIQSIWDNLILVGQLTENENKELENFNIPHEKLELFINFLWEKYGPQFKFFEDYVKNRFQNKIHANDALRFGSIFQSMQELFSRYVDDMATNLNKTFPTHLNEIIQKEITSVNYKSATSGELETLIVANLKAILANHIEPLLQESPLADPRWGQRKAEDLLQNLLDSSEFKEQLNIMITTRVGELSHAATLVRESRANLLSNPKMAPSDDKNNSITLPPEPPTTDKLSLRELRSLYYSKDEAQKPLPAPPTPGKKK